MNHPVSPLEIAARLAELWSPRVIAEVDESYVKVAKVQGTLGWHAHDNEDELFLVLDGHLRIELEDRSIELAPGQLFVVPKGVRHNPVALETTLVMLVEHKRTLHTGNEHTDKTRSIDEQLRPVK